MGPDHRRWERLFGRLRFDLSITPYDGSPLECVLPFLPLVGLSPMEVSVVGPCAMGVLPFDADDSSLVPARTFLTLLGEVFLTSLLERFIVNLTFDGTLCRQPEGGDNVKEQRTVEGSSLRTSEGRQQMTTNKELEAKVEALMALLAEKTEPETEPVKVTTTHGETRTAAVPNGQLRCGWTVKVSDPIDALIVKAAEAETAGKPWSSTRMDNLQAVSDLNVGDTCNYAVRRVEFREDGSAYDPLCRIHVSMAAALRRSAWDNSATKERKIENETAFDAAMAAAGKVKGDAGTVRVSNVSFGQYLVREQGAEYDGASVVIRLPHGAKAFAAAVKAATFTAGQRPMVDVS